MSEVSPVSDDVCYRHPARQSFVLCQRCTRTICGPCQTPAAVGVVCPECLREERKSAPPRMRIRLGSGRATATIVLLVSLVAIYAGQILSGGSLTQLLVYWPPLTFVEPWRMLTSVFAHSDSSVFHILFNGYSLYVLGTLVERLIGPARFVALFLLSGLGGSVAVLWLSPQSAVLGASGAIFGLFGALFVIQRSFGGANTQLLVVLGLNLVLGFVVPGISWQAHIGGLLVGALVAWVLVKTRDAAGQSRQTLLLALVAGGLVAATALRLIV